MPTIPAAQTASYSGVRERNQGAPSKRARRAMESEDEVVAAPSNGDGLSGGMLARIATVLASEWREANPGVPHDAAVVLDRLADVFASQGNVDETACSLLLSQLDLDHEAEWELVNTLRAAVEDRSWLRHPSRGTKPLD